MERSKGEHKNPSELRNTEMNTPAANKLREASSKEKDSVYVMMETSVEGLSEETAKERISKFGLNEVDFDKAPSWRFNQWL